jgi:hypothetical protein
MGGGGHCGGFGAFRAVGRRLCEPSEISSPVRSVGFSCCFCDDDKCEGSGFLHGCNIRLCP